MLTGDGGPQLGLEANDQTDLFSKAAHIVPGNEEAVGVSSLGLAVVGVQLVGAKVVFSRGARVGWLPSLFVEGVDDHIAFDLDRGFHFGVVEHDASAEATGGLLALGVADRVDPDGNDPAWEPRRVFVFREERH